MKKGNLLLTTAAAIALLAGCNNNAHHFGFGTLATYKYGTTTRDAEVQTDIAYVAVGLSKNKITHLRLDVVQIKANLVAEGEAKVFVTNGDENGDVASKWELLEDYNMIGASPIGKEWYEQAAVFENWAIGKTIAQVKSAVGEDGSLTDGVNIGATVTVSAWVSALEDAVANKVAVSKAVSALGVGGKASISVKRNTTIVDGHDYYVAGAAFDEDHKVLGARVDTFQMRYVESDDEKARMNETLTQIVASEKRVRGKHEQKEDYAMVGASPIGKEWYEQANALQDYVVGKTVSDALGSEDTLSNGIELGITVTIDGYRYVLLEAEQTAFNSRTA